LKQLLCSRRKNSSAFVSFALLQFLNAATVLLKLY